MVAVDAELCVTALSGASFSRHGIAPDAYLGRSLEDVLPAAEWQRAAPLWIAATQGRTTTVDWESRAGGKRIDYWLKFAPQPGGGAVMVALDVTERAAANRQLSRRLRQQEAVARLGSVAVRGASLDRICAVAAGLVHDILAPTATAVLSGGIGEPLRVISRRGERLPPALPIVAGAPPRVFDHVRATGRPVHIGNLAAERRVAAPALAAAGIVSVICAPVGVGADAFGVIGACSRSPEAFDDDDLAFLEAIGNLIADTVARQRATDRVSEAESRLAAFWECSRDLLMVLDAELRIVAAGGAWQTMLGWPPESLVGRDASSIVHPEDHHRFGIDGTVRVRSADDGYRSVRWDVHETTDGTRHAIGRDVTAHLLVAREQHRQSKLLADAQRIADIGSWDDDFITETVRVSGHLRHMLRLPPGPVTTKDLIERVHPADRAELVSAMSDIPPGSEPHTHDFRVVLPGGAERLMSAMVEQVHDADGNVVGLRGTIQDVTERRTAERDLRLSQERFRRGFDEAPIPMAVVCPATGEFERLNEAFCRLLRRERGELEGASLFGLLAPDAADAAVRALRSLEDGGSLETDMRFLRGDESTVWGETHVSRVGSVADGSASLLIQIVDVTDRHEHEDALRRQLSEVSWIGEIRRALLEDRFEIHAQPIVDMRTNLIVHHELLLRMRDGEGNLVSPCRFLPAAERYGDIRDIDRWVVGRGVELSARSGMSVAINLSGASVGDPTIGDDIELAIASFGADPSKLIFEVTETCLVANGQAACALGERLRELGCHMALDDFGTGYGGFHYLKSLPLDYLKIDREFVADACHSEADRHLIWAAVHLARKFGLTTIAEGIEDEETMRLLASMNVDEAQGFHIGRPTAVNIP